MSKMPAIGKELYDHYALMSAQTHEALVKEYARYAVDIALSNVPRGAINAADTARAQEAEVEPVKFPVGTQVEKSSGYQWPGEVRSVFTTKNGHLRYVVECTVVEVAGALHIYSETQLRSALTTPPAPQPTDREKVLDAFEKAYPELFWHVGRGKVSAGEPLYGAIIATASGTEIGHGESDLGLDDAFKIAIRNAGLEWPVIAGGEA